MTDEELLEAAGISNTEDTSKKKKKSTKKQIVVDDDNATIDENNPMDETNSASEYLGTRLTHDVATGRSYKDIDDDKHFAEKHGLTKTGGNIFETADIKDGWINVDRRLLGDRDIYYPEEWRFRIRPATVEAIRNWSTLDETIPNSVDNVFNEMLKSCLSIVTPNGTVSWNKINTWDRFFFILLIREYTFKTGEKKIEFTKDCPECDKPVTFKLESQSLMFDLPDESVMKYYDQKTQTWTINPAEFGDTDADDVFTFYLPTLDKGENIKNWLYNVAREEPDKKLDAKFMELLPWIAPKISRDYEIAKKQIRQYNLKYKSWDEDTFLFIDDIIKNISVTPKTKLIATCPNCGEEVTADIRFPDGLGSIFSIRSKFRKFGSK